MDGIYIYDPEPALREPVVMIHGLGADASSWGYQVPALISAGYRPISIDVPGFGKSPYDGKGWNLQRISGTIIQQLEAYGLNVVNLLGLSMGGIIAQQIVMDHPSFVRRLILASSFATIWPENLQGWMYFLTRFLVVHLFGLEAQANVVARRVFPGADQEGLREEIIQRILKSDPRAYRAAMRALAGFNSTARLGDIAIPVLVITGENDSTVSPRKQTELAQMIPGVRHEVIRNAGHAVSVDQPDEFNQILLSFLNEKPMGH